MLQGSASEMRCHGPEIGVSMTITRI
jgi:hypothetical protein